MQALEDACRRIGVANLRLYQRVELLDKYAFPKVSYRLAEGGEGSAEVLNRLDTLVKEEVTSWVGLPMSTPMDCCSQPVQMGGWA